MSPLMSGMHEDGSGSVQNPSERIQELEGVINTLQRIHPQQIQNLKCAIGLLRKVSMLQL